MRLLDMDGPLIRGLTKMADLMLLNLLFLFCSIPIVTIGASCTALHYVALKLVRNEETYVIKQFFHSFKENFRQATLIWLMLLAALIVLCADVFMGLQSSLNIPVVVEIIGIATLVVVMMAGAMVFALLSKFANPALKMIKSAFLLSIAYFPKVICMLILYAAPYILCIRFLSIFPLLFVFGVSLPAFLSAMLYDKLFREMEERTYEATGQARAGDEDEHIFSENGE